MDVHWKDWCWSWNSNTLATWCKELTHLKRPLCWERLRTGREGDDRGWDGWMASPTQWTWVWVDSGSWWWSAGVLQFMGLQRVGHNWATELNWTELTFIYSVLLASDTIPAFFPTQTSYEWLSQEEPTFFKEPWRCPREKEKRVGKKWY